MKYKVMLESNITGFPGDLMTLEWSGILHDSREEARKEMSTIGRDARERCNIVTVYIQEVEYDN